MSKLTDKLERMADGGAQPMGFTTSASASELPQILTIAQINPADSIKAQPKSDIDAVLLGIDDLSKSMDSIKQAAGKLKSVIWGVQAGSIDKKQLGALAKLGCDFVILKLDSPSAILAGDNDTAIGIEIAPSIDDTLLRTVNLLSIDAVIIIDEDGTETATIEHTMQYYRLAAMVQKPTLISLSVEAVQQNLGILHDAGISGVIVPWDGAAADKKLSSLTVDIKALPKRKKKKDKKKSSAILPNVSGPSHEDDDEEYED
ncbi:MAG: hypothetical protein HN929_04590 [Chloroflexi bacterium]|jgi:hypothetical protein|nr:hypothetical protein [Chloroflexota bacterium]MBT7080733.1 hypothetical protein [Chloroflexota bacterium]MBT7290876.1 hypothetical protein [Chloroflexota bacterium]